MVSSANDFAEWPSPTLSVFLLGLEPFGFNWLRRHLLKMRYETTLAQSRGRVHSGWPACAASCAGLTVARGGDLGGGHHRQVAAGVRRRHLHRLALHRQVRSVWNQRLVLR